MKNLLFLILFFIISSSSTPQSLLEKVDSEIEAGKFSDAKKMIDSILVTDNLSEIEIYELNFKIDLMRRIKLDFRKNKEDIVSQLQPYFTSVTDEMLNNWEKQNSLEYKIIDGEKKYFNNAVPNLFRVNKSVKAIKEKIDGISQSNLDKFLAELLPGYVHAFKETKRNLIKPVKFRIKYSLTLKPNVIPNGEIVRAWLPYPRQDNSRHQNINLVSTNLNSFILSSSDFAHSTIYFEQKTEKDKPTHFEYTLEYLSYASYMKLDEKIDYKISSNTELYKEFTSERLPHIKFSEKIKFISKEIIGAEKNNYKKVKLIIEWITKNIPWASAREYSTLPAITDYCIDRMHGDCGIKSLLFITLCRYNGVPAKWQSGWMLHPNSINLHDWAEIYLDEFGWITVDPDFGIQPSDNDDVKYFYTSGIDAYRYIVNDDFSKPLYPSKIFPRSETVDFQRGEVEWRGGNLYFDKWNYKMNVEYLSEDESEK